MLEFNTERDIKKIIESTAYHEASHYVLQILSNTICEDFGEPEKLSISLENGKPYGDNYVYSETPNFVKSMQIDEKLINQIIIECLILLAGYTSFKVIYYNGLHFIRIVNTVGGVFDENSKEILRSINEQLDFRDERNDIEKVKDNLEILFQKDFLENISERHDLIRIMTFMIYQLEELMKEEIVMKAIEIVKNKLIDFNGRVIEKEEVAKLNKEIKSTLKDVNFYKYVEVCKEAYGKNDWNIEYPDDGIPPLSFVEEEE